MITGVHLSATALKRAIDSALNDYPLESVGLLGGADPDARTGLVRIDAYWPLTNLATDRFEFDVEPYSQYVAERAIARLGLQRLAILHTHPDGSVMLSDTDIEWARRRPELQIVMAVSPGEPVRLAAHRVDRAGRVQQVTISLEQTDSRSSV